jgi:hypothetical protein
MPTDKLRAFSSPQNIRGEPAKEGVSGRKQAFQRACEGMAGAALRRYWQFD